jgi:hypothetical protein
MMWRDMPENQPHIAAVARAHRHGWVYDAVMCGGGPMDGCVWMRLYRATGPRARRICVRQDGRVRVGSPRDRA